jgi:hypothetical protein
MMKLPHRRHVLRLAAGAAALPTVTRIARAQAYPSRPVRIIVSYPAGSGPDLVARLVDRRLSDRLGQQFVVENGPGTSIATEMVVRAPPDGYTLFLATSTDAINAALYPNLSFDFIRDIAPVASIGRTPVVMAVNPSLPAKTLPDFIAYAKANPGKLHFCIVRQRDSAAPRRRAVQDDDQRRIGSRAVSRQLHARSARRTGASRIYDNTQLDRVHSNGQIARSRGCERDALGHAAGRSRSRRICAGL